MQFASIICGEIFFIAISLLVSLTVYPHSLSIESSRIRALNIKSMIRRIFRFLNVHKNEAWLKVAHGIFELEQREYVEWNLREKHTRALNAVRKLMFQVFMVTKM